MCKSTQLKEILLFAHKCNLADDTAMLVTRSNHTPLRLQQTFPHVPRNGHVVKEWRINSGHAILSVKRGPHQ